MPVPLVPSESSCQGTATTQYYQGGSLCSPGSPQIFTDQVDSDLEKTTNINAIKPCMSVVSSPILYLWLL